MTGEPIDPDRDALGEAWLAAATGGGLPEPARTRWQPLRVGIVNLWEYDDAEFWFADGRLVLRGGNGAGKTKVLELTTLMLLRGEITPSVLDPFGSQHRTMRFNLLPTGDGDDPRERADAGLGYAWAEFGRRDERGEPRFFVCGMGASARRGSGTGGVSTWHFLTPQRPGKDFALVAGGRAIERRELAKLDGLTMPASATAYRARLAGELFGVTGESYDNITELLKQLRKPKLGERLNPASLADTLRDALPPLASGEVTQLAEGWEHLDQLRKAVEQTEEAATAVAQFVRAGWRPWARVVVRRRADEVTAATTSLDNTTRDKNRAEASLATARAEVHDAEEQLHESTRTKEDRETELRELLESRAYRDAVGAAQRVEELRRAVTGLTAQRDAALARLAREEDHVAEARRAEERARVLAGEAEEAARDAGERLAGAAGAAGLAESVDAHLPGRDLDALAGDCARREERFAHLRGLHAAHAGAERAAQRSAQALEHATDELASARDDERAARTGVGSGAELLSQDIRRWAGAARVAPCPPELVEDWCDLVPGLTVIDEQAGSVVPGPSPAEAMRAQVGEARRRLAGRAEELRLRRAPLHQRHDELGGELAQVRARTETPPAEPRQWRRRERPAPGEGLGAPLWRLANPSGALDGDGLDRLEAGLAASGLLDAWVTPDGILATAGGALAADVQPLAAPAAEPSLLAVLEPDSAGGVSAEVVRRLLGGIGWCAAAADDQTVTDLIVTDSTVTGGPVGDWVAADGSWRVGGLTGRAEPAAPASYLGAAAREAARRRAIARLEAERAALASTMEDLDGQLAAIAGEEQLLDGEEAAIPVTLERSLVAAVATLADRARRRAEREARAITAGERHAEDLARTDRAWAAFADYAGEHRFGLRDLDGQQAALGEFRARLNKLEGAVGLAGARGEAREAAARVVGERDGARQAAAAEVEGLEGELRQAKVRLGAAEDALGSDHQVQLQRRRRLDTEITGLGRQVGELTDRLTGAKVAAAEAAVILDSHEARRAEAEQARDGSMAGLWAALDAGLAEPAGVTSPERRTVQAARELAAGARREITVQADAAAEDTAWRRCYRLMEELRQKLLPNRDARVDQDDSSTIQQFLVLADPATAWQPPHRAADALAERVRDQQRTYDDEQQRVLTTLLGSTFIEHLKERLDYTAHTFARINDQLARHPTRHGHAVRVLSEPDPADPDTGAVVTALDRGYHELSTDRQDMVRAFLARKIDEARADAAAQGTADWTDQLGQALDYRRWLRLSLQYRPGPGSSWSVFDAARHAAKSGGEKVVLLSQPLFAAAVVAYDAAGPLAPRWVWLDEAMTGVDAAVKASFMGLTVEFELDVMLTAHDEWCNYATVPAVAVYDLARQEHLPGVDALPYLWCGGSLTAVDVDRLGVTPRSREIPADGLFAALGDGDDRSGDG